jgi:hypothetical protein
MDLAQLFQSVGIARHFPKNLPEHLLPLVHLVRRQVCFHQACADLRVARIVRPVPSQFGNRSVPLSVLK